MKFGGTSVGTSERIGIVARHVLEVAREGRVVVVVSAMSGRTDGLLELARSVAPNAPAMSPEIDNLLSTGEIESAALLALAINECAGTENQAIAAESLLGFQIGLRTDGRHGGARIKTIEGINRISQLLEQGRIVVVPGFQGVREGTDRVTTFGRGGGDLTPVAIAGALKTGRCRIYTDVDGVYAINPRLVPQARRFSKISHEQMLQLAVAGAKVLMDRCVRLAQSLGISVQVLLSPSFGVSDGGTLVTGSTQQEMEESVVGTGLATREAMLVRISEIPDKPGMAQKIIKALSGLSPLESLQPPGEGGRADMSFLFLPKDTSTALSCLAKVEGVRVEAPMSVAALTLVYPFMPEEPNYLDRAVGALATSGVNIEMFRTAATTILFVVQKDCLRQAALALGEEFELLNPA
jgi:aspartate kinase